MRRRNRIGLLVATSLLEPLAMRARGYPISGDLVVRCRRGHLFTALWIPGASIKAFPGWAGRASSAVPSVATGAS